MKKLKRAGICEIKILDSKKRFLSIFCRNIPSFWRAIAKLSFLPPYLNMKILDYLCPDTCPGIICYHDEYNNCEQGH